MKRMPKEAANNNKIDNNYNTNDLKEGTIRRKL